MQITDCLQYAADSVLMSDRRMSPEFGGQRFTHIDHVSVEGGESEPAIVTVYGPGGQTATAAVHGHRVPRPKDRALAPADCTDAIEQAIKDAGAELGSVQ